MEMEIKDLKITDERYILEAAQLLVDCFKEN